MYWAFLQQLFCKTVESAQASYFNRKIPSSKSVGKLKQTLKSTLISLYITKMFLDSV